MHKSSLFLLSMLCASTALAEPPAPPNKTQEAASALVNEQLVKPLRLAEARRSRFSRAARPPKDRRVRVLDPVAQTDVHGKHFVRFAVDVRYFDDDGDSKWKRDVLLGCAYVDQKEVFLQRGEAFLPASSALGQDAEPQPDACRAAPADAAQASI